MENEFEKIYQLTGHSRAIKNEIRGIEKKIDREEVVRGFARAGACISSIVTSANIIGSLVNLYSLDNIPLTPDLYSSVNADFETQIIAGIAAGIATIGCVAVSRIFSSIIKTNKDDLNKLKLDKTKTQEEIDALNEEFNKEPQTQIFNYEKDSEYSTGDTQKEGKIEDDVRRINEILKEKSVEEGLNEQRVEDGQSSVEQGSLEE